MLDSLDTWSCSSAVIFPCRPPGSAAAAFSAARLQCININLHTSDISPTYAMAPPTARARKGAKAHSQPAQSNARYGRPVTPQPLTDERQVKDCHIDMRQRQRQRPSHTGARAYEAATTVTRCCNPTRPCSRFPHTWWRWRSLYCPLRLAAAAPQPAPAAVAPAAAAAAPGAAAAGAAGSARPGPWGPPRRRRHLTPAIQGVFRLVRRDSMFLYPRALGSTSSSSSSDS